MSKQENVGIFVEIIKIILTTTFVSAILVVPPSPPKYELFECFFNLLFEGQWMRLTTCGFYCILILHYKWAFSEWPWKKLTFCERFSYDFQLCGEVEECMEMLVGFSCQFIVVNDQMGKETTCIVNMIW